MDSPTVVNALCDLLFRAMTTELKRKTVAKELERLGLEQLKRGADDETLTAIWSLAAELRHHKHVQQELTES
jgi:hypothetical protein